MSVAETLRPFEQLEAALDVLDASEAGAPIPVMEQLLSISEEALSQWIVARGDVPTRENKEGFRLLALQRQGAKGDPSFNACRESCRELAYAFNVVAAEPDHAETPKRLRLAVLVARHIVLFVSGKMQVAGLGEFCCSSKPVRASDGVASAAGP